MRSTPCCADEVIGQVVKSWLMSDCAPSRAVSFRDVFSGSEAGRESGLGSLARR